MNFDLTKLMKQAQEMQKDMKSSQEELEKEIIEAEAGAGMIKIKATAIPQIINIEIEESIIEVNNREMLEDLLMAAFNTLLEKAKIRSEELIKNKTSEMMSKINLTDLGKDI